MEPQHFPKILLVDDEPDLLHLLERRLVKAHYAVTCAVGGKQGIEFLQRCSYAAVICDINMPGDLSGFEVYDYCAAHARPRPFFLFVSGHGDESPEAEKAASLPVDGVFAKPLNAKELFKRLSELLVPVSKSGSV